MNIAEATALALFNALQSPTLGKPGGCLYTDAAGKHCIVGQVLANAGASLPKYGDDANNKPLMNAYYTELRTEADRLGFDPTILNEAQDAWDSGLVRSRTEAEIYESVQSLINRIASGWFELIPPPVLETA